MRCRPALFDGTVNMPVMHQAVKAYLANQRQGNAATKTRKFVVGGNQKPWKQKGTGRARQGSTRAPHWVGGGTVFGPTPRSYEQYVPRQVRALAQERASTRARARNAIFVIDRFDYDAPKTKRCSLVSALGVGDKKVLILTDGVKPNVYLSGRNLPRRARDAVQRRVDVPHPVVGRRADRGDRVGPRAAPSRPRRSEGGHACQAARRGEEGEGEAGQGAKAREDRGGEEGAAKPSARRSAAKKKRPRRSSGRRK